MQTETVTQSHILTPGVEQSFGTLADPHALAEIIVNANGDPRANGSEWRLYDVSGAGEALVWRGALAQADEGAQRLTPEGGISAAGLYELRAVLRSSATLPTTLAITASLTGYDPACCESATGPEGPAGPPGEDGPTGPEGPAASVAFQTDNFTPTEGQTAFTLSSTSSAPQNLQLFVNGVLYLQTTDYTVSGTDLTWLNNGFSLDADDWVEAYYQVV